MARVTGHFSLCLVFLVILTTASVSQAGLPWLRRRPVISSRPAPSAPPTSPPTTPSTTPDKISSLEASLEKASVVNDSFIEPLTADQNDVASFEEQLTISQNNLTTDSTQFFQNQSTTFSSEDGIDTSENSMVKDTSVLKVENEELTTSTTIRSTTATTTTSTASTTTILPPPPPTRQTTTTTVASTTLSATTTSTTNAPTVTTVSPTTTTTLSTTTSPSSTTKATTESFVEDEAVLSGKVSTPTRGFNDDANAGDQQNHSGSANLVVNNPQESTPISVAQPEDTESEDERLYKEDGPDDSPVDDNVFHLGNSSLDSITESAPEKISIVDSSEASSGSQDQAPEGDLFDSLEDSAENPSQVGHDLLESEKDHPEPPPLRPQLPQANLDLAFDSESSLESVEVPSSTPDLVQDDHELSVVQDVPGPPAEEEIESTGNDANQFLDPAALTSNPDSSPSGESNGESAFSGTDSAWLAILIGSIMGFAFGVGILFLIGYAIYKNCCLPDGSCYLACCFTKRTRVRQALKQGERKIDSLRKIQDMSLNDVPLSNKAKQDPDTWVSEMKDQQKVVGLSDSGSSSILPPLGGILKGHSNSRGNNPASSPNAQAPVRGQISSGATSGALLGDETIEQITRPETILFDNFGNPVLVSTPSARPNRFAKMDQTKTSAAQFLQGAGEFSGMAPSVFYNSQGQVVRAMMNPWNQVHQVGFQAICAPNYGQPRAAMQSGAFTPVIMSPNAGYTMIGNQPPQITYQQPTSPVPFAAPAGANVIQAAGPASFQPQTQPQRQTVDLKDQATATELDEKIKADAEVANLTSDSPPQNS